MKNCAMSYAATVFQQTPLALPVGRLLLATVQLTVLGGVLVFFRPLLTGIARAMVLTVRPRPTKDVLAARRARLIATAVKPAPAAASIDTAGVDLQGLAPR